MKMNNNGQSLVIFIILLPLIITFCGFFIEKSNLMYQENKLSNVIELSCKETNKVDFINNNIGESNIKIDTVSKTIKVTKEIKPVIASTLGFDNFKIEKRIKCKEWNNG